MLLSYIISSDNTFHNWITLIDIQRLSGETEGTRSHYSNASKQIMVIWETCSVSLILIGRETSAPAVRSGPNCLLIQNSRLLSTVLRWLCKGKQRTRLAMKFSMGERVRSWPCHYKLMGIWIHLDGVYIDFFVGQDYDDTSNTFDWIGYYHSW